jgi:RNA polymerase sigma factor (sigma-70 family)
MALPPDWPPTPPPAELVVPALTVALPAPPSVAATPPIPPAPGVSLPSLEQAARPNAITRAAVRVAFLMGGRPPAPRACHKKEGPPRAILTNFLGFRREPCVGLQIAPARKNFRPRSRDSPIDCQEDVFATHPLSFERVYDQHFGDVRRWVRAHGARPSDVEDLVQEVFLVAYRRLADFDGENVAGWLYRITSRKVRDARRVASFKYFFSHRAQGVTEQPFKITPLDELETSEKLALVERALVKLSARQRAAFVLYEIEGYTGEEIAKLQAAPINTVWTRIFKARQVLRARKHADRTV